MIDHAVRAHFGVDAKVALVVEAMQHGFGDGADSRRGTAYPAAAMTFIDG